MIRETDLKKSIVDYLKLLGFLAWVQNVGGVKFTAKSGKQRFVKFGFAGLSDILCVLPGGRFLVVETKRLDNVASQAQKDFIAEVERRGGIAVLAYSLDDVDRRLRSEGFIR
jgi:hypothetical protein